MSNTIIYIFYVFFFFFQAEDGIRDDLVTGVQTCALPIYGRRPAEPDRGRRRAGDDHRNRQGPAGDLENAPAGKPHMAAPARNDPLGTVNARRCDKFRSGFVRWDLGLPLRWRTFFLHSFRASPRRPCRPRTPSANSVGSVS